MKMEMKRVSVWGAFRMCSIQLWLPTGASPTESNEACCVLRISHLPGSDLLSLPSSLSRRSAQLKATIK